MHCISKNTGIQFKFIWQKYQISNPRYIKLLCQNIEILKKLLKNKLQKKEPSTKIGLARMLGISRQSLYDMCHDNNYSAKETEQRLKEWIKEK